jgi:hypothetical protein
VPGELESVTRVKSYQRLSLAEKRAEDLSRVRETAVTCPSCDTQVMPADLLAHIEQRCPGPREPGPGAKWVNHREALGMGVSRATLSYWTRTKKVRFLGERQDRRYLMRDLALSIAHRRRGRRR